MIFLRGIDHLYRLRCSRLGLDKVTDLDNTLPVGDLEHRFNAYWRLKWLVSCLQKENLYFVDMTEVKKCDWRSAWQKEVSTYQNQNTLHIFADKQVKNTVKLIDTPTFLSFDYIAISWNFQDENTLFIYPPQPSSSQIHLPLLIFAILSI